MNLAPREVAPPDWVATAYGGARAKLDQLVAKAGAAFLHATVDGRYPMDLAWWWTSGFWPGLIRLRLNDGPDARLADLARQAEDQLFALIDHAWFHELHHDVGFQFQPTAVMRFKQTGAEDARRRGLVAANLLMGRFNVAGGVIEAWNAENRRGYSIIDTFMNLPLLFWASEVTGEPRFANLARGHLSRAIPEFIRADDTTHHIVEFDQRSGARVAAHGGQGYAADSAWSRGQSWAVYGLAIAARYTGHAGYREKARTVADRFLEMNAPHGVPPWDFRAPDAVTAPRDSSAAAVTACGLLELARLGCPRARGEAEALIRTLTERCTAFDDPAQDGLLLHATGKLPQDQWIDVSLIYGDYYYYEALQRLAGTEETCW
ncbi:glycoside hydrolase family 88 protein [Roseobacter sinensis]|uniref:Glycoside hydrolase family 88 protein n=1 Tax=Roseobacter sinensis TaxID=2931391 RepID=A0ABT3BFI2_9RHOB|nr:glycoside hydrolase family 88 protein [Roseobacter sp. WL0113]MCV3272300.1 glycoside hydrolase family 88 protein [Roseobacter sp. WL0113]